MKNYLIIGGSSGIGQALATQLVEEGHQVYATYCNHPQEAITNQINYQFLDVTAEFTSLANLPDNIDGLVYCPGTIDLKPFKRIKPDQFIEDFNLQVLGAIKIIQQLLPKLKASNNGSIVLFSTVAVQKGFNFHSKVAVSKGAIEGLTKSLAAELAPNIRINAIAPSITDTPLASRLLNTEDKKMANVNRHPLKRIGSANDIANMASFLLSEKAKWITGQIIHIDGGMSTLNL